MAAFHRFYTREDFHVHCWRVGGKRGGGGGQGGAGFRVVKGGGGRSNLMASFIYLFI